MYLYKNTIKPVLVAAAILLFSALANAAPTPWTCTAAIVETLGNEKIEQILSANDASDYSVYSPAKAATDAFNQISYGSLSTYCGAASLPDGALEYTWEIATSGGRNFCAYTCRDEYYGLEYLKEYLEEYATRRLQELMDSAMNPRLE
jgi:hypothetical protein